MPIQDISGQRFGRLTAVEGYTKNGVTWWRCRCSCGKEHTVQRSNLGRCTFSCGCQKNEAARARWLGRRKARPHAGKISYYKSNARKRGVEWRLTDEQFRALIGMNCAYCGGAPINGIDRVDNKLGYTVANSVACCTTCNRAKLAMSRAEFVNWVDRVHAHLHARSA